MEYFCLKNFDNHHIELGKKKNNNKANNQLQDIKKYWVQISNIEH